jgi:hypothetical protein
MRSLKKGTIGAAMMSLGFFAPGLAGGYYQRGVKKDEDEAGWDELMIGGVRIPTWATHFPLFEAIQLGATMRQVMDRDIDKDKTSEQALSDGIIKSARGMIDEIPLFRTPEEITEGVESGDFLNKIVYPEMRSMIPIGVQEISAWTDTDQDSKTVKRKPEDFLENMEYGLPSLRQNVPEK